jgi:EAL domain-containing protein (putative c-di-GMP-specific phosphodiesterase class I)
MAARRAGLFGKACAARPADLIAYAWDLSSDRIAWGPGAADLAAFGDGAAFARALEADGGTGRAEAIAAATAPDAGHGSPFACRYALNIAPGRWVAVEDRGRWFADPRGRPALARGLVRLDAADTLGAAVRARAALLGVIEADRAARGPRWTATVVVGRFEAAAGGAGIDDIPARLRGLMRRKDRLIPYGPDRFAVLLPCCPPEEAGTALALIADLLGPALPNLMLGAAAAPADGAAPADIVRCAEAALAPARRPGLFSMRREPPARSKGGTQVENILAALNGREIDLALYPALDGRGGEIFASALPAIRSAPGPGDLAAAAEREGLSELLDLRALEEVASRLQQEPQARLAWRVSAATLRAPDLLSGLAAHLGARPGVESRLIVEVPEEALGWPGGRGRLDAIKALGAALMLGGFGQGHAVAGRLSALPFDLVRIDPRLVERLSRAPEDRLRLRTLIERARHLGLVTIADGVTTECDRQVLAAFGVDAVQGEIAGPPVRSPSRFLPLAGSGPPKAASLRSRRG